MLGDTRDQNSIDWSNHFADYAALLLDSYLDPASGIRPGDFLPTNVSFTDFTQQQALKILDILSLATNMKGPASDNFTRDLIARLRDLLKKKRISYEQARAVLACMVSIQHMLWDVLTWDLLSISLEDWRNRVQAHYSTRIVRLQSHCPKYSNLDPTVHNLHLDALTVACCAAMTRISEDEKRDILDTARRNLIDIVTDSVPEQVYFSLENRGDGWHPANVQDVKRIEEVLYQNQIPSLPEVGRAWRELRGWVAAYIRILRACSYLTTPAAYPKTSTSRAVPCAKNGTTCLEMGAVIEYHLCHREERDYVTSRPVLRLLWGEHAREARPVQYPTVRVKCRLQNRSVHESGGTAATFTSQGGQRTGRILNESKGGYLFKFPIGPLPPYAEGAVHHTMNGLSYTRRLRACWQRNEADAAHVGLGVTQHRQYLASLV